MTAVLYALWETALERFFYKETGLFYEFVADGFENAWDDLPTVYEIKENYPNPCGWGTGMEDSVMNTCTAIDALISAHNMGVSGVKELVRKMLCGIMRCADGFENDGFVARSVSPFDGKSHYIESSRDQYTHFVYSLTRLYFSELSDENSRELIKKALVSVAEKCKREIVAENDYNMLREDGSVGKVCKMWGDIGAHEYMRLPMFLLAAFKVSGDASYYNMYRMYRDEALENSLDYDEKASRLYCALQMMCSLKLVYEYDEDEGFRQKLLPLMKRLAMYAEEKVISNSAEFVKASHRHDLDYTFKPWRNVNMHDGGTYNGYRYLNPGQSELRENVAFYPVREVGEGAILMAMCPQRAVSKEVLAAVVAMAKAIDIKRHSNVYPLLYFPCAYALCTEKNEQLK